MNIPPEAAVASQEPFYPELLDRYAALIRSGPQFEGDHSGSEHLLWMLERLRGDDMSLTKKHRWLGFIQGILIARGLTTVAVERDHTRTIFDGD